MRQTVSLSARFGWLGAHATHLHAALLAAHGAATPQVGFRAADVRFFFLLFTNWMESDVLRPGQDVDLTQVRRMLDRLTRAGLAAPVATAGGRARERRGYRSLRWRRRCARSRGSWMRSRPSSADRRGHK
jgi:hypothetical protein